MEDSNTNSLQGSSIVVIYPGFLLAHSLNRSLVCAKLLAASLYLSCSISALCPARGVSHHCACTGPDCCQSTQLLLPSDSRCDEGPDENKRSPELRFITAEAEGALDLVVWSWVGGSEKKKPTWPGPQFQTLLSLQCAAAAGGLCPCSPFRCYLLLFVRVIMTDFKRRGSKCHGRQRLSGKACWLASSPLAEACDWLVLS